MTNFDENGIMYALYINLSNDKVLKITVEGNEAQENIEVPKNGHYVVWNGSKKMIEMNVDLSELTNYLIQLFYKSGKRFSCTRTKIGKMLSILAFYYAVEGKKLFKESIYKYCNCGSAIVDIMDRFTERKDIYIWYGCDNSPKTDANKFDYNEETFIPAEYNNISSLSDEIKDSVKRAFETFAIYSPEQLGELINTVLNSDGVVGENGEISLLAIKNLSMEIITNTETNTALVDFLSRKQR